MRFQSLFGSLVFSMIIIASCSHRLKGPSKAYMLANDPKPVMIDGFAFKPKLSTHLDKVLNSGNDTLALSVNSTYVYYPFGLIKSQRKPNLGVLRNFKNTNEFVQKVDGELDLLILTHRASKIILYFTPNNGSKYCDLVKGTVSDDDVKFINGIKIGMGIQDFYSCFFDQFPLVHIEKYKVFVLQSSDEKKHFYTFENGNLKSVRFSSYKRFGSNY